MQRTILFIITSLFVCMKVTAQIPETIRRSFGDGREFVQIVNNKKVQEEGYTLHNLKEGLWTLFWETNIPQDATNYRQGKRSGLSMHFTRDGFCEITENYINDTMEGPRRVFGRQMNMLEESYYANGKKTGFCKKWFASGAKQEESVYQDGLRQGTTTWYYENGQKAIEYNYKNGEIDGNAASYWENGQVSEFGKYENGYQTGLWKEYYEDGAPKAEGNYIKGKKAGKWAEYKAGTKKEQSVKN